MELRHLRYFIAVAEELSFSRAAERLSVSQPPLSRQIRDLEDELNVKLFERNHQEVKLTTVGQALLIRARGLVREAELLRTRAHQMEGEVYEELQLGYAPAPTVAMISGILSRYHELAPGALVTLHDLSLSEILTGLKTKKLHAGLTLQPRPGEMRGVEFEPIRRYSVGIICAKSCPLAKFSVIRPSVVPPDNLIGYRAAEFCEYHQWVAKVLGVNKTRVIITQACDGVLSLVAAVESGCAPAVVGEFTTAVAADRVRYIPFVSKPSFMDVGLLYMKGETAENVLKLLASSVAFKEGSKQSADWQKP
ncbi:MAG TPA: LysR family transcriptional regulator [Chthoniobacterales bacterium]|jgi:LysR family transcriptional regulator, benzoate and cis,cis-muconate-responsive activator of ben and cat genes|nr:LysR family transcriptional regulator [Chthoniobacterales bacterium]